MLGRLLIAGLPVIGNAQAIAEPTTASTAPAQTQPSAQAQTANPKLDSMHAGLAYLAQQQNADGSFQTAGAKLQISALTLLGFLSAGNMPDSGKYGDAVRRVVEFLLRQTPGDRYFGRVDGSGMRGQAIVTLALCEAYGVEPDEQTRVRLRATAKDAVAVILTAQNSRGLTAGGWAAESGNATSDRAISTWCMIALRAAQQIGLGVPQANVDRATAYLRSSAAPVTTSFPATSPAIHSADALLYDLYTVDGETNFMQSSAWKSAAAELSSTQLPSGAWTAANSPATPSPAETANNVFLLGASQQLLPVWMK
jgi:hypothetical protein